MASRLAFILILLTTACRRQDAVPSFKSVRIDQVKAAAPMDTSVFEKKLIAAGLVDIKSIIPDIFVDLRYSGTNNFLKTDIYGDFDRAYLQPDVAEMLKKAREFLRSEDSSLTFIIYDAARPSYAQKILWDSARAGNGNRTNYVSNPDKGSLHNYGAAVDLSICHGDGAPLDMGTDYDFFGDLAQPQLEAHFLTTGELTRVQYDNRIILRKAMRSAGFRQLPTEWWHYNACSRETAKLRYKALD